MLEIINLLLAFSSKIGYFGVAFLMTIESSFVPFPSEVVILPAAYLSQQGEMNIIFVILAGIFGSLFGATINYILAFTLGRKLVYSLANSKFAKILLISEQKIIKAEQYFLKYGNIATFVGRLVPAIRQLISIPAGFSKMNFKKFIFYTFLGSGIWTNIDFITIFIKINALDLFISPYFAKNIRDRKTAFIFPFFSPRFFCNLRINHTNRPIFSINHDYSDIFAYLRSG